MTAPRKPLAFDIDRSPPAAARVPTAKAAPAQERQQVGARVTAATYRQLKARAALQGVTVQTLVEQAITEFLANHAE
jgi:predicted DNA binding CopG/RHH family protein